MRDRFSFSITMPAIALVVGAVSAVSITGLSAQAPALKTAWGEPDLQGIWTDESDTPLQRSPRFANQEFFSEEQRAEFDRVRSQNRGRDERGARGSELDVAGAYNDEFGAMKRTGKRTSAIIDPPNGRIPPMTSEAQKIAAADRELRLALMQATQTCKQGLPGCAGGKFDPTPTTRRSEQPAQKRPPNPARTSDSLSRGSACLGVTPSVPIARPVRDRLLAPQPAVWRSRWPCRLFWLMPRKFGRPSSTSSLTMAASRAFLAALSVSVPFWDRACQRPWQKSAEPFSSKRCVTRPRAFALDSTLLAPPHHLRLWTTSTTARSA